MIGREVGPYRVVEKLGEGGMGEVYRGRDTKLDRDVALKILPVAFASDPDRLMRFEREAKTLAALNHPHIAHIYGIEEYSGGTRALVMELVEGDDLSSRLASGPLSVEESIRLAMQIADALDAAHERGIVHRDLKPANIKLTRAWGDTPARLSDGRLAPTRSGADVSDTIIKVLDFGLAKSLDSSAESSSGSATITSPALTAHGVVLGTAAYMSPEQAKGRAVDRRTDIWAFGCVLYEMLTGKRAFPGDDISDTLVAIMRDEPDYAALPASTPPHLRVLLTRCLRKDPRRRLRDIGDVRLELESPTPSMPAASAGRPARLSRREAIGWSLAGLLAIAIAVVWSTAGQRTASARPPDPRVVFGVAPPSGSAFTTRGAFAVSPDGRSLAFVAADSVNRSSLWVRSLETLELRPVGTGSSRAIWAAASPSWSPDGQDLVITAGTSFGGAVRRLDLRTDGMLTLADWGTAPIWGLGGVVFTGRDGSLYRVDAGGGTSTPVTTLDAQSGETRHLASTFLPDGRRFLYFATNKDSSKSAVFVGSVDGADRIEVPGVMSPPRFADGYLWYLRSGTLLAQPFDPTIAALQGDAIPVAEKVDGFGVGGRTLVTQARDVTGRPVAWLDPLHNRLTDLGPSGMNDGSRRPDLSRDGSRLAFTRRDSAGNTDVWVLDLARNIASKLTSHPADESAPVFSPDGSYVVFGSNRSGPVDLYRRAADGSGDDELLYSSPSAKNPTGFSADGSLLLFGQNDPRTGPDILALPMTPGDGKRTPHPIAVTAMLEGFAVFSPDGKWIAYCAGDAGEGDQVFVVPYPPTGSQVRLSSTFGSSPQWSETGREVFFGTPDGTIMRVAVTPAGGTIKAGVPQPLIKSAELFAHFGFVPDRKAAQLLVPIGPSPANRPLTVTVNWRTLLTR